MTPDELRQYRVNLFRDATSMERKPDRIPHLSNFWTWQVLDMGYKFSQATHDYDVMEKVMLSSVSMTGTALSGSRVPRTTMVSTGV